MSFGRDPSEIWGNSFSSPAPDWMQQYFSGVIPEESWQKVLAQGDEYGAFLDEKQRQRQAREQFGWGSGWKNRAMGWESPEEAQRKANIASGITGIQASKSDFDYAKKERSYEMGSAQERAKGAGMFGDIGRQLGKMGLGASTLALDPRRLHKISSSGGTIASALAKPTLCCIPPDNWLGY